MNIAAFVHPRRCTHPLGGVGRHAAEMLRTLSRKPGIEIEMLMSRQFVDNEGRLGRDTALPRVPVRMLPLPESLTERCWKIFGWPKIDRWVKGIDWVYSPMETYLPSKRVPVAITIHDVQAFETNLPWSDTPHHRRWRAKWSVWIHKALRDSRIVFTVSEFSKWRLVELLGANPDKVVVVGNGVGPEFFAIGRHADRGSPPYALVIGGLRHKKGGAEVLAAARALRSRGSEIRVVIAGLNDSDLTDQAGELPNVDVMGTIPEPKLHQLLGGASSLLLLSPYEGFGFPVLEAMAAGVPVIASNRASLPETVGDAGILVEPGDSANVADVLLQLDRDPSRKTSLIAAGRQRAAAFTWDRCAETVLGTFRAHA